MTIEQMIEREALARSVDPKLALAVARAESCGATCSLADQARVSTKGAIGIFQLMPKTAAWLGVNPYDLQDNIQGGVDYLARLLRSYNGDLALVLAAYNWGPGNLAAAIAEGFDWFSRAPAETRNYLFRIFSMLGIPFSGSQTIVAGSSGSPPPVPRGPNTTMLTIAAVLLAGALILTLTE